MLLQQAVRQDRQRREADVVHGQISSIVQWLKKGRRGKYETQIPLENSPYKEIKTFQPLPLYVPYRFIPLSQAHRTVSSDRVTLCAMLGRQGTCRMHGWGPAPTTGSVVTGWSHLQKNGFKQPSPHLFCSCSCAAISINILDVSCDSPDCFRGTVAFFF